MENEIVSRSQKSQAVKNKISKAGLELFRKYGYDNVSVKMITEVAGVSIGSFYHFFGSKSGLLDGLSAKVNNMFSLPDDLDYATSDCKQTILSFYETFCNEMQNRDKESLENIFLPKGGNKTLLLPSRSCRRIMKILLSGFQNAGKIRSDRSVDALEEIIMTCFLGTCCHWVLNDRSYLLYDRLCCIIGSVIDAHLV